MTSEQTAAVRPGDQLGEMIEGIYPLSPAQHGILFDCLYRRDPDHYVSQRTFVFEELDPVLFALAWRRLFDHHPILRTGFIWEGLEHPVQVVLRSAELPLTEHDLRSLPEEEQRREVAQCIHADLMAGFDFTQAPLLRLALYRLGEHTFQFACTFHHLLQDGWSQTLLVEQLVQLYGALAQGAAYDLGSRYPFSAYLEWLSRQDRAQAESFWRRTLAGFSAATPLGEDGPGDIPAGSERQWFEQRQLAETGAALRAQARHNGLTPNTFMQGAWALLLGCESGQRDVVFGVTVAGRPADLPGVEVTAGPFVNVLPLRIRRSSGVPLLAWLRGLQSRQAEQRQYEYSSLNEVHGWSEMPRSQPLFASTFTFQNRPAALGPAPGKSTQMEAAAVSLRSNEHGSQAGAMGFPLIMEVELGAALTLSLFADRRRFSAERTRTWLQRYVELLELLVVHPEADVDTLVELLRGGGQARPARPPETAGEGSGNAAETEVRSPVAQREYRFPFERGERGGAFAPREIAVAVTPELAAGLASLAAEHNVTAEGVVLAAWYALLWRLTEQPSIVVATGVEGHADLVPVPVELGPDLAFDELVQRVAAGLGEARYHDGAQAADFFPLTCELGEAPADLPAGGVERSVVHLACRRRGADLAVSLRYDASLLARVDAERLAGQLLTLLHSGAQKSQSPLYRLETIGEAERLWLLDELNRTAVQGTGDELVHELFAAQARRTPLNAAVIAGEHRLTYEEVARQSNQLAHYLRRQGIGSEHLVGLCVDRTPARVIGVLGVLKAGAAYLPLDPAHPQERQRVILEEARPPLILVQRAWLDKLPPSDARILCLETVWEAFAAESTADPDRAATPQSRVCVLYTSGSTGSPKGVMVTHRSVCNHVLWARQTFGLGGGDRVLHNVAFNFDASVLELFGPLVSGATIVASRPGRQGDSGYLARLLRDQRICACFFVPSMLRFLLQEPAFSECVHLRVLWCGGEPMPVELRDLFVARLGAELSNFYGPTETTINSTYWRCLSDLSGRPVPLGLPIANTRLFVVDADLDLVPTGAVGELLIGGAGVSRGYLRQPDRTAASFIPDPFSGDPGERLYRSGDLIRYRPDGVLEYLGRKDFQIKIRGLRIELGEVETALGTHPRVEQAVVTVCEEVSGHPQLVAYLVARGAAAPGAAELRAHLQQRLPEYMVPTVYVSLVAMPLNPNGKLDRRALPAPTEGVRADLGTPYVAPRNPVEELLCDIWSALLGVERIGVEDDFFQLGGQSLLALQMLVRLRDAFAIELPLDVIFDAPTIAAQGAAVTAAIQGGKGCTAPPVLPVPRGAPLPLSFAQQRLWFLDQLDPGTAAYNIPYALRLVGPLRAAVLAGALQEVVRRHEALRARFVKLADGPAQVFSAPGPLPLPLVDLAGLPAAARQQELRRLAAEEARQPFDLSQGPLLRTGLLRLHPEEHAVLFTLHHVAGDAWSMNLLLREVTALYQAFAAGRPSPLAELPVQYADYAVWQRGWLRGEILEEQLAYWRRQLTGAPRELRLPTDLPRPVMPSLRGASQSRPLPSALDRAFKTLGQREGTTPFMTLLAALGVVLCHLTGGQEDLILGSNAADRSSLESEGLIGFFINMLALRFDLTGDPSFRQLLGRMRTMTLSAYAHQELPFETLVHELQLERRADGTPLIQAVVDFQTAAAAPPELPGLALELLPDAEEVAKFDLTFILTDSVVGLRCTVQYRADLFYATTIAHLLDSFELCLTLATADPEIRLSALRQRLAEHDHERTAAARESLSLKRRQRSRHGKRASVPAMNLEGES